MQTNTLNIIIIASSVFGGLTIASICTLVIIKAVRLCKERFNAYFPEVDDDEIQERKGEYTKISTFPPKDVNKNILFNSETLLSEVPYTYYQAQPYKHYLQVVRNESIHSSASFDSDNDETVENVGRRRKANLLAQGSSLEDVQEESEMLEEPKPDYITNRRATLGVGNLGKIRFCLRFSDKTRKNLQVILHSLDKLLINSDTIMTISVSIELLPDRKNKLVSKGHFSTPSPVYEETFNISQTHTDYGFEMKSLQFVVKCLDKSGQEIPYGEAKLPLLCSEIYNQTQSELSLNIKYISQKTEIGDILLQLRYSDEHRIVTVKIITVKFFESVFQHQYSEILINCKLKKNRDLTSRKPTFRKSYFTAYPAERIDVDHTETFPIQKENFLLYSLKISIKGRSLPAKNNGVLIGKVVVGANSEDGTSIIHWRTILMSPELAWTVWHPVYSS